MFDQEVFDCLQPVLFQALGFGNPIHFGSEVLAVLFKLFDSKLQARLDKAKERREAAKRVAQAKVAVLKTKAAVAQSKAP